MTVVFYVSAHGYGHASRQAALIAELARRRPGVRLLARSQAPAWLLAPGGRALCRRAAIDPGVAQPDGFTVDVEETLRRHERFARQWKERVEREAAFLRRERAGLVVSDIGALAFAAAGKAQAASVGIGNFSWDVVLAAYGDRRRWRPIIELYRRSYGLADEFFQLPMHLEAPAFRKVTECPLLARRSALTPQQARRALNLAGDGRPLILASFGGLGRGPLDLADGDDLSDFVFAGFGPPPRGLKAPWFRLPERSPTAAVDAMAACDAVLAKPGYGVLSEALTHGKPVALAPRRDFAETPALVADFLRMGRGTLLLEEEFRLGRWKAGLLSALASARKAAVPCDGAAFLAGRLPSC